MAPAAVAQSAELANVDSTAVNVQAAPYRASINVTVNVSPRRFDMRNATIVNMIDFAQGREDDDGRESSAIVGGPAWIDLDRFDIAAILSPVKAVAPGDDLHGRGPGADQPYARLRPLVQQILEQRFHLVSHTEDRPLPGFAVTLAKDGPRLQPAKDPSAPTSCHVDTERSAAGQQIITCTSETIAEFLTGLGGTFRHPLIDQTGLTRPYDFTLRLDSEQLRTREDSIHAYMNAINRQLGIVITAADVPQPAFVVDKVDRVPTPNAPGVAKRIPPLPPLEFEVASIRPAADTETQSAVRPAGSQITFSSFSVLELLTRAWQLPTGAMLANASPSLGRDRYTILVKLPPEIDARALSVDQDQLAAMLQRLLVERFRVKWHWGEQAQEGYVLLAGTPKMKKADPASRSFCKYGPPEGEKDLRTAGSAFNGEFHCQNVTMAQFADLIQPMAKSEVKNRVADKTGLAGAYTFAVVYTTARKLRSDADAAAKLPADAFAAPSGGASLEEAFRAQLGLKLVRQIGTYPALILDHIEPTPTEN